jgi:abequosyltransferase
MPEVQLSICIPIYNFGAFIADTLDSIREQCQATPEAVEVLVVDGASTDNTAAVVGEFAAGWTQLRYVRLPRRGGIDADLAESVRLARGEYCWLFSGDDVMREGAVEKALQWLRQGHDVYLCKHFNCDLSMKVLGEHPVFRSDVARTTELGDPQQRLAYMSEGVTTEAVFSFMSSLIVRRDKWLSVPDPQEFMGSCWGHVARFFMLAQTHLRVCYVGEIWVERRGENDSFLDRGVVNRLRIAVDGFHGIANRFFRQVSQEAAQIRRMVRNDLSLGLWLYAKYRSCKVPDIESRRELDRLIAICYGDPGIRCWLVRTTYRLMPARVYPILGRIYHLMPSEVTRMLRWFYRRITKTPQAIGARG